MIIRKATKEDSKVISSCLLLAMEDIIFEFIGVRDKHEALGFLQHFIEQENNQYSYENCRVSEDNNEITGAVIFYNGSLLHQLRKPVGKYISETYHKSFDPEDETGDGEIYIDSIGVSPDHQGKGIGSGLIKNLIEEFVYIKGKKLGLLVEKENTGAKKLYLKLGFKIVGEKTLAGKSMYHLQKG